MCVPAELAAPLLLAAAAAPQSVFCNPVVEISWTPCLGQAFTLTTTADSRCCGCTLFSFDPGPTLIGTTLVPLGPPADYLFAGAGRSSMTLRVPMNADFLELDVHFAAVFSDGTHLESSAPVIVRVCP